MGHDGYRIDMFVSRGKLVREVRDIGSTVSAKKSIVDAENRCSTSLST